jgi:hypothetical protein
MSMGGELKNVVIRVDVDLPPRSRALKPEDLSSIFGGCGSVGRLCKETRDCCTGVCYGYHPGYRMGTCMK